MQQVKQPTFKQYVMAGNELAQREHILVSSHVTLDNPGEQDARESFRSGQAKRAPASVSLRTMAIVLALCVLTSFGLALGKMALTGRLSAEYAQLGARYQAAQAEKQRLEEVFAQKSDASGICYYAVQALGMRLAGDKETISVQAAGLPTNFQSEVLRGTASNNH